MVGPNSYREVDTYRINLGFTLKLVPRIFGAPNTPPPLWLV